MKMTEKYTNNIWKYDPDDILEVYLNRDNTVSLVRGGEYHAVWMLIERGSERREGLDLYRPLVVYKNEIGWDSNWLNITASLGVDILGTKEEVLEKHPEWFI